MRLLIVTQRVDREDPILGFFHAWITALSKHVEHLTVIGQQTGAYQFPGNVRVVTLGKESNTSRLGQIIAFWNIIWNERSHYDCVFVHMTPVWVVLGWPVFFFCRKRMYLWYEARGGGWSLRVALHMVRAVFGATDYGLPRESSRHHIVGHGIDTERFCPAPDRRVPGLVVAIGRITPVKHYEVIFRAFSRLPSRCRLKVAGGGFTDADRKEEERLQSLAVELGIADRVETGWVSPLAMPELLQQADILLHACRGGLDKCVLEAMACGCPVATSSAAAERILSQACLASDATLHEHAQRIIGLTPEEREKLCTDLRSRVEKHHSLASLAERLIHFMH